jgi:hypothetical protein
VLGGNQTSPEQEDDAGVATEQRGEMALRLQERNRHIDITTARYYVDAVCDMLSSGQHANSRDDLERNSRRYLWLRDAGGLFDLHYNDHGLGPEFPSGEELDAAIDAAMSDSAGEGGKNG